MGHGHLSWASWTWSWAQRTRLLKCNLVCICLHVACFSIWVAHRFMQNWMTTSQSLATDPSNRKWSLIDCKTASRTSCYSWGLSADPTPQSHCALPLLLPVNQSEPSVFVMVEDNQFQNKEKMVEIRQAWRRRRRRCGRMKERGSCRVRNVDNALFSLLLRSRCAAQHWIVIGNYFKARISTTNFNSSLVQALLPLASACQLAWYKCWRLRHSGC